MEPLKVFLFVLRPPGVVIDIPEQGYVAVAFTMDEAIAQFQRDSKDSPGITAKSLGTVTAEWMRERIPIEEKAPEPPPEASKKTKEQFIANLQLGADEFLSDEKDKAKLKAFIAKMSV